MYKRAWHTVGTWCWLNELIKFLESCQYTKGDACLLSHIVDLLEMPDRDSHLKRDCRRTPSLTLLVLICAGLGHSSSRFYPNSSTNVLSISHTIIETNTIKEML